MAQRLLVALSVMFCLTGCGLAEPSQSTTRAFSGIGYAPSGNLASSPFTDGAINLYDSSGNAAIYIAPDDEATIYLWSGKPCAYLSADDIYGFNGKHLGWMRSGVLYDHGGHVVAAPASAFLSPTALPSQKGLKQLRPIKAIQELSPLKPLFMSDWSAISAKQFILAGAGY